MGMQPGVSHGLSVECSLEVSDAIPKGRFYPWRGAWVFHEPPQKENLCVGSSWRGLELSQKWG